MGGLDHSFEEAPERDLHMESTVVGGVSVDEQLARRLSPLPMAPVIGPTSRGRA
jgi:hypothetical protein